MLLLIDSLFTETAISFLIADFNKSDFIYRDSNFKKCLKKCYISYDIFKEFTIGKIVP